MKTTETKACACPACRAPFECATSLGREVPRAGDLSLCINCGSVLVFRGDLTVREITPAELAILDLDTYAVVQSMRSSIVRRGPI